MKKRKEKENASLTDEDHAHTDYKSTRYSVSLNNAAPLLNVLSSQEGERCSSVVTVIAHGVMDHQINPSWWTN